MNNPVSFSLQQILDIHREIILRTSDESERNLGGVVRDEAMICFLLEEIDDISDPFEKAACVLYKVAVRHPFVQGNKRLAFTVAHMILYIAGWTVSVSADELNEYIRMVARDTIVQEEVCLWLKKHAKKRDEDRIY